MNKSWALPQGDHECKQINAKNNSAQDPLGILRLLLEGQILAGRCYWSLMGEISGEEVPHMISHWGWRTQVRKGGERGSLRDWWLEGKSTKCFYQKTKLRGLRYLGRCKCEFLFVCLFLLWEAALLCFLPFLFSLLLGVGGGVSNDGPAQDTQLCPVRNSKQAQRQLDQKQPRDRGCDVKSRAFCYNCFAFASKTPVFPSSVFQCGVWYRHHQFQLWLAM